jgi:hypothetical protein
MSIRVRTLRALAQTRRNVYRVRWRFVLGEPVVDTDGSDSKPDTWSRWEEDYYISARLARDAVVKDPWGTKERPKGVIDQVPAAALWAWLEDAGHPLEDYSHGTLDVVYSLKSGPDTDVMASPTSRRAAPAT